MLPTGHYSVAFAKQYRDEQIVQATRHRLVRQMRASRAMRTERRNGLARRAVLRLAAILVPRHVRHG